MEAYRDIVFFTSKKIQERQINTKNKIGKTIIVLLTVMALLTGIVPFASRTATAETTELQEGAVYRTGDKILLSENKWVLVDDSPFNVIKQVKAGTYEVGRIYCPTVYIGSDYSWYIDDLFEVVGEDSKRDLCIGYYDPNKSDKEIFVTGIRCAGGTGEKGTPYYFKLIYEEKASLTITAIDQTYKFNGEIQGEGKTAYKDPALIAKKIDVKGLKEGDTIASVVLDGQGQEPDEYDLVPSDAVVYRDGENVTDRYNISYVNGKLIIEESEVKYPLWVGSRQVTSKYLGNETEGWSYDPDSKTLTLNNANITDTNTAYLETSCISTNKDLTISLTGNNTVGSIDSSSLAIYSYDAVLTIDGSGSLTVNGKQKSIEATGKLIISTSGNSEIKATATSQAQRAIAAICALDSFEINGPEIVTPEDGKIIKGDAGLGQEVFTVFDKDGNVAKEVLIKSVTPEYTVTSGADGTYTLDSGKDHTFTVKLSVNDGSCFDRFLNVELDGEELTKDTDYTVEKGSTVVTLKSATLNKLSEGDHTITVNFTDGKTETNLTVKKASSPTPVTPYRIPKTGVE